jgi:hypothetical protein
MDLAVETLALWCQKRETALSLPPGAAFRAGALARFFGGSREYSGYRHLPELLPHWERGFEAMDRYRAEGGVLACPSCLQPWPEPVFPASSLGENLADWVRLTKSPSPNRYDLGVHRSGAFARLAGGVRVARYQFHEKVWLRGYDAMDGYLSQGGIIRCPCCDRPWSVSEGFSFPPISEWRPAARMLRAMASDRARSNAGLSGGSRQRGHPPRRLSPRVTLLPAQGQISLNRAAASILGVDERPADLLLEWFHRDLLLRIRRADGPVHLSPSDSSPDTAVVRPITLYPRRSTCGYIVGGLRPFFDTARGFIRSWRVARRFAPEVAEATLLVNRSGPYRKVGR